MQRVISDAHPGLKQAVAALLICASWRVRLHFVSNVLAVVPKGSSKMVTAAIRTVFPNPTPRESPSGSTPSP